MSSYENENTMEYFYIYKGRITKKVPQGTIGSVVRVATFKDQNGNETNKEICEKVFKGIKGKIINFKLEDVTYAERTQQTWKVFFDDNGSKSCLNIPFNSKMSSYLLKCVPNINIDVEIAIEAGVGNDKSTGKEYEWLKVYEYNKNPQAMIQVMPLYSKNHPDFPSGKYDELNEKWDYSEQREFLKNVGIEFSSKFKDNNDYSTPGTYSQNTDQIKTTEEYEAQISGISETEDLPF